jgi:DNA-3-methyladenine glycosylase II
MQKYFFLKPLAPFRLDLCVWGLRRRNINILDQFDNNIYRRVLVINNLPIGVSITQSSLQKPVLKVQLTAKELNKNHIKDAKELLKKILGTQIDLEEFYDFSHKDKLLKPLAEKYIGFKPPRFASLFEAGVNGICCQQLSLTVGITLLNRLSRLCCTPVEVFGEMVFPPPTPQQVAKLNIVQLRNLGFSSNKAVALLELAKNITEKTIDLEKLEELNDEDAIAQLSKLRGLGQWTARYILLRGMRRLNIFPSGDSGFLNGLKLWLDYKGKLNNNIVHDLMKKWNPYAGMVYFYMLLRKLTAEGFIT